MPLNINQGKTLRRLMESGSVVAPGAWNALVARAIVKYGFCATYISGGASSNARGFPDIGLLSCDDICRLISEITNSVNIPVIADADTGHGNVSKTVVSYANAGAVGLHIEDQVFPKRCGHLDGKELIARDIMGDLVLEAVESKPFDDFFIIARTDARGVTSMGDAIDRANYYRDRGADVIFPEGLTSKEEFRVFSKESPGFLLANMTEFGKTPFISHKELEDMGYQLIIHPVSTQRVAMHAIGHFLETLSVEGYVSSFTKKMQTREDLYNLLLYEPNQEWNLDQKKSSL